jgi:hypothetical protein
LGQDPEVGNRLVYNYPVSVVREFVENYLSFFSPEWLFLRGDSVLRHSTGQTGVFYVWMLPFMLWGAMKISNIPDGIRNPSITEDTGHGGAGKYQISNKIQNSKFLNYQTFRVLFLTWILASPIPAAITNDGAGYLLRAVTMLPFLTVFCAIGIVDLYGRVDRWNVWGKWGYVLGLVAIGLYSGYYFLFGYFHVYPALAARSYEYGFKELAEWQTENRKSMLVIWKGYYPENYFRFWQKESDITTGLVDEELLVGESRFYKTDADLYLGWPKKVEDLENFIRVKQPEIVVFPDGYLDEHEYYRRVVGILKEAVYYPDGGTAFDLYDRINSQ